MTTILMKIGAGITATIITIAGFVGFAPMGDQPMGTAIPQIVALFETTLATKITSTGTSMTLTSGDTEDGTTLSGFYGFIIDEGTASEEFVTATCTDTSCTSMTRGISAITGDTEISALKSAHRRGASVKITNHPVLAVMARIMNGDETFPNTLTYASSPTFSGATEIVDKNYVDSTFVGLTGAETIAGAKTFSTIPLTTGGDPSADNELVRKAFAVWVSGNQTIAGVKTFSSFPITPSSAPTTNYQVSNKKYVDDISVAGAPNATTTVKGIVEMGTTAEINAGTATGGTGAALAISPDQLDGSDYDPSNFVAVSGNETIAGIKTFSSIPVLPASNPTTGNQATRKTYVDTQVATKVGTFKNGVTTYDLSTASGTQNIAHGLGATPRFVRITATIGWTSGSDDHSSNSYGVYNGTTNSCVWNVNWGSGAESGNSSTYGIWLNTEQTANSTRQKAVITFDATNIILTWTKEGTPDDPSGTLMILWEAYY